MRIELADLEPFKALLRDVVGEELRKVTKEPGNGDNVILDVEGLARYLSVSEKWIYERTHLKQIPFIKLSSKELRFRKKEIDRWLTTLSTPALSQFTGRPPGRPLPYKGSNER